jgi:porphobilinogen synthase
MRYPIYRPRRIREQENLRRMVRETQLSVDHFIYPLFVVPGEGIRQEIQAMPGNFQLSIDRLLEEVKEAQDLGIPAIILFGLPAWKDTMGSSGYAEDGIIPQAISALKKAVPGMTVITDVCLCEYTSHGHCGVVEGERVLNDASVDLLAKASLAYARAGADMVAPSDMMDGRVQAIRLALDGAGFHHLPIMSYAAKYASSFYGPFREAADSAPQFGDRRGYQMDPANSHEAMREIRLDIEEGADIIMVKPALPYLDIIYRVKQTFDLPVAAYNVSGEYAMIKAAALQGWIDGERVMLESLLSIRRAGADMILTYFAKEAARLLTSRQC